VLIFDASGCLRWAHSDFESSTWRNSLEEAMAAVGADNCHDKWSEVAAQLGNDGVLIASDQKKGRHALIWYGSSDVCPPCEAQKALVWDEIKSAMPDGTISIVLDWK
jgi:hypothetical protein